MDIALFQDNVEILRNSSGKWVDKRLVMMTAAQSAAKGKRIIGSDFTNVIEKVKNSSFCVFPIKSDLFFNRWINLCENESL